MKKKKKIKILKLLKHNHKLVFFIKVLINLENFKQILKLFKHFLEWKIKILYIQ